MTNPEARVLVSRRGFSAIEMLLVIGLSGILLVGLTAMIDMPQQMAAREEAANPSVAAADVALAALDRDVRFATDVRVPTSERLEIDRASGGSVVWEVDSVTHRLLRTEGATQIAILRDVEAGGFALHHERIVERVEESKPVTTAGVTVASFDSIQLKAGYTLGTTAPRGSVAVTEVISTRDIDVASGAGIFLTPAALGTDVGVPSSVRLRLQRNGTGDLLVRICEADPATRRPIRTATVANGRLYARQIPVTMSNVTVPLAMERRIDPTKYYFVQMRSSSGPCAKLETKTLSIATAAAASTCGLLVTADGGSTWNPIAATLDASQTRFGFDVARITVDTAAPGDADGLQAGYDEVDVAVAVAFKLAVSTPSGVETLRASFPVQNNLAIVKR